MSVRAYIDTNKDRFLDELFSLIRFHPSVQTRKQAGDDPLYRTLERVAAAVRHRSYRGDVPRRKSCCLYREDIAGLRRFGLRSLWRDAGPGLRALEQRAFRTCGQRGPDLGTRCERRQRSEHDAGERFWDCRPWGLLHCNVKFIPGRRGGDRFGIIWAILSRRITTCCACRRDSGFGHEHGERPPHLRWRPACEVCRIEMEWTVHRATTFRTFSAVLLPIQSTCCARWLPATDSDGRITLPGFYDDGTKYREEERDMIAQIPFDEKNTKQPSAWKSSLARKDIQRWSATASVRRSTSAAFGADTSAKAARPYFRRRLLRSSPVVWCRIRITRRSGRWWRNTCKASHLRRWRWRCTARTAAKLTSVRSRCLPIRVAAQAVAIAFGVKPLAVRRGRHSGHQRLREELGLKSILMGFGLEQNAIHSPNESCRLDYFYKGIEAVAEFIIYINKRMAERNHPTRALKSAGIEQLNAMQKEALSAPVHRDLMLISPTGSGRPSPFCFRCCPCFHRNGKESMRWSSPRRAELALSDRDGVPFAGNRPERPLLLGGHPFATERRSLPGSAFAAHRYRAAYSTIWPKARSICRGTFLILDEFDQVTGLGFKEMRAIIASLSCLRRRILTSATNAVDIPPFVGMKDPIRLDYSNDKDQKGGKLTVRVVTVASEGQAGYAGPSSGKNWATTPPSYSATIANRRNAYPIISIPWRFPTNVSMEEWNSRTVKVAHPLQQRQQSDSGQHRSCIARRIGHLGWRISSLPSARQRRGPISIATEGRRVSRLRAMSFSFERTRSSLPEYITPYPEEFSFRRMRVSLFPPKWATVTISGKRDKLSKSDVVRFLFAERSAEERGSWEMSRWPRAVRFAAVNADGGLAAPYRRREDKKTGTLFSWLTIYINV